MDMLYSNEDYVPLNWDKLVANPDVFEAIKEEIEYKFGPECLMTIITAAKQAGLSDEDIFLPIGEDDKKEEYASVFSDSVGNSIED